MARRRKKRSGDQYDVSNARNQAEHNLRELSETQNLNTQILQTQVMEKNMPISGPSEQKGLDSKVVGTEIANQIRELIGRFAANVSPMNGAAAGGPGAAGTAPGAMGGAAPPVAKPISVGTTATQDFLARDKAANQPTSSSAGARGINFAAKALGDFADNVGGDIGRSGLEKSAGSTIRENSNPGRFVESALGTASKMGIPGAAGLQGVVHKLNQEAEARDGTSALNSARARLADIAGGLAQRGAHFSDQQLTSARNVLQQRAQNELNVRLQISRLEEGYGAQRSGLGMGGHAR